MSSLKVDVIKMARLKRLWDAYQASRVPYLSEARIQEIGNKRLRKISEYAYRTVSYYHRVFRQLGLRPTDIRCTEDLQKLPKISKVDIQKNPKDFISREIDISQCRKDSTSGSTGTPADFYYDDNPEATTLKDGIHWRHYSLIMKASGRRLHQGRLAFVCYNPSSSYHHVRIQRFQSTYPLITRLLNIKTRFIPMRNPPYEEEKVLGALREFKPNVVFSSGWLLEILARYVARESGFWPGPNVVVFTGDAPRPVVRRFFENELNCEVFGIYGACEAPFIGFECEEHSGYHINTDAYPVSVIGRNGEPVEEGRKGQVVVSNLINRAMVLLNCRLGDVAEMGGSCTCRRNLPMIRDVLGRIADFVVIPNDELVSPFRITSLIYDVYGIKQYQVIQNDLDDFLVKIVPDIKADPSALSQEITLRLKKILGSEAEIIVHYVKDIPRPSGKARLVISKVPIPSF